MIRYLTKRVIGGLGLLVTVSFLTFFLLHLIPGDAAQIKLGLAGSKEAWEVLRSQMGLDRPWYWQYMDWLSKAVRGDLGVSAVYGQPVAGLIARCLPVTLSLLGLTFLFSVPLALVLGIASAVKQNSPLDVFSRTIGQLGLAIPSFWVGIVLILFFSLFVRAFPPGGFTNPSQGLLPFLRSLVLPASALSLAEVGILLRMIRASMLQVLEQDYIRYARRKGISRVRLYGVYAFRNAMIAPLTVIGLELSGLLGGSIVIEDVFALPGLGRLLLVAVQQRDYVLLQGVTVFITAGVILVSLLVDLVYVKVDPRIELT